MLDHAKDFGFGEFLSQRYHYSRSYAGMRNAELGTKRLLYALGSPLIAAADVRAHREERARATPPTGARSRSRNAADPRST